MPSLFCVLQFWYLYTPSQRSWWGDILESPCPSVCLSVCPSVCRRHGFRSVTQVCFGISIWNFICMLLVAMGRSLFIFSNVSFKMAAWQPSWVFRFLDSNLFGFEYQVQTSVAHYQCVWKDAYWFSDMSLSKWPPGGPIGYFGFWTLNFSLALNFKSKLLQHISCMY